MICFLLASVVQTQILLLVSVTPRAGQTSARTGAKLCSVSLWPEKAWPGTGNESLRKSACWVLKKQVLLTFLLHFAGPFGLMWEWALSVGGSRAQDAAGVPSLVFGCHQPSTDCHLWMGTCHGPAALPEGSARRQKDMEEERSLLVSLALQRELESAVGRKKPSKETFLGPRDSQITERSSSCVSPVCCTRPWSVGRTPFCEPLWSGTGESLPCLSCATLRGLWRQSWSSHCSPQVLPASLAPLGDQANVPCLAWPSLTLLQCLCSLQAKSLHSFT